MKLRREARIGFGAIMVLQLALSMLTIALLTRMGPAIERILTENVRTEVAVEKMLAELAKTTSTKAVPPEFTDALERAENNITEEEERPLLKAIADQHRAAFSGDEAARVAVIEALRSLGAVNRASMARADNSAKRLGQTGAWAAALLGAIALGLCLLIYQQLRVRIELPIEGLRRTTKSLRQGNLQARCPKSDAPAEINQIALDIDWLLDHHLNKRASTSPTKTSQERERQALRRLLVRLLDEHTAPMIVTNAAGKHVASNDASLDLDALPDFGGVGSPTGWRREEIEDTDLIIWSKRGDATRSAMAERGEES